MERLPDELLLEVLRRLGPRELIAAARVCRRWAALTQSLSLHIRRRRQERHITWATRSIFITARGITLTNILSVSQWLQSLTVDIRAPFDSNSLKCLELLTYLDHLDIFLHKRVIDTQFLPIAHSVSSLVINETVSPGVLACLSHKSRFKALHMYGRAHYYHPREMAFLLVMQAPHLRELTLRCSELTDAAYIAIGSCTNLTTLRLYSCWMLTAKGTIYLSQLKNLRKLHITGARMLRKKVLLNFLEILPSSLEELVLSAGWFGDDHIATLINKMPLLQLVEFWRCHLTANGVCSLAAGLPALVELDVDLSLGADELRMLSTHPKLKRVRCIQTGECPETLVVVDALARYGRGALRGGGEGFRSELFYSWSTSLRPLPARAPPPAFDDDDEDDYTLLGSDVQSDCDSG